jgi:hypothetical protein
VKLSHIPLIPPQQAALSKCPFCLSGVDLTIIVGEYYRTMNILFLVSDSVFFENYSINKYFTAALYNSGSEYHLFFPGVSFNER